MVKRKSVREVIENPQPDEYYVLVTRYVPMEIRRRGLKVKEAFDDWDRDLAPSRELLKDIKSGKIGWDKYAKRFYEEKPDILIKRKLAIFEEDAHGKEVVLVCIEEDSEYPKCHTWLILGRVV